MKKQYITPRSESILLHLEGKVAIQLTSDPNKAIGSEEDYLSDRRDENPIWGDEDMANGGLWK